MPLAVATPGDELMHDWPRRSDEPRRHQTDRCDKPGTCRGLARYGDYAPLATATVRS